MAARAEADVLAAIRTPESESRDVNHDVLVKEEPQTPTATLAECGVPALTKSTLTALQKRFISPHHLIKSEYPRADLLLMGQFFLASGGSIPASGGRLSSSAKEQVPAETLPQSLPALEVSKRLFLQVRCSRRAPEILVYPIFTPNFNVQHTRKTFIAPPFSYNFVP